MMMPADSCYARALRLELEPFIPVFDGSIALRTELIEIVTEFRRSWCLAHAGWRPRGDVYVTFRPGVKAVDIHADVELTVAAWAKLFPPKKDDRMTTPETVQTAHEMTGAISFGLGLAVAAVAAVGLALLVRVLVKRQRRRNDYG